MSGSIYTIPLHCWIPTHCRDPTAQWDSDDANGHVPSHHSKVAGTGEGTWVDTTRMVTHQIYYLGVRVRVPIPIHFCTSYVSYYGYLLLKFLRFETREVTEVIPQVNRDLISL